MKTDESETLDEVLIHLFPKRIFAADENQAGEFINLENEKNEFPVLLLLLNNISTSEISESDIDLLKKMVDWLGIRKSEVVALNLCGTSVSFQSLVKSHGVKNMICYGISPDQVGLQTGFSINKPFSFMDCVMMFTAPLFEIQKNGVVKNKFFEEVKKFYGHLNEKK